MLPNLYALSTPLNRFYTLMRGGSGINVVPGSCEAYGDVRLLPGTSPEEIKRLITEQLERFSIPNSQLEDLLEVPAAETHLQAEVVQTLAAVVEAITGTPTSRGKRTSLRWVDVHHARYSHCLWIRCCLRWSPWSR